MWENTRSAEASWQTWDPELCPLVYLWSRTMTFPAEGTFWLLLCQMTRKWSQHMPLILWHTEEYVRPREGSRRPDFMALPPSAWDGFRGTNWAAIKSPLKPHHGLFFSKKRVPVSVTVLWLMLLLTEVIKHPNLLLCRFYQQSFCGLLASCPPVLDRGCFRT